MIILFSGLDKQKGFNINIQKVINKELSNYKSMAIICASDDYSKNDIIIDGTNERIGVKEIFRGRFKEKRLYYLNTRSRTIRS